MACSRGKAHPDTNTKLKLFSHSGGFCQNPSCDKLIFPEGHDSNIHIAEMAHIFACADNGPRAKSELSEGERGAFDNIILLCANCHTEIDKAPEKFDDKIITKWKRDHWEKIKAVFGAVKVDSREKLRECIDPLLGENKATHKVYGPDGEYRDNPEAPEAAAWKMRVRGTIIPNSNRVISILEANRSLLSDSELEALNLFKVHVGGLILRHLDGQNIVNSTFPLDMNRIARD